MLQHKHKMSEGYEQYKQSEIQKFQDLQANLVLAAESKAVTHFSSKYGAVKLAGPSKAKLEIRKGANGAPLFDGTIEVALEISAGAAAKKISCTARVEHSTISLPKFKFLDKIVSEAKTSGELQAALPSQPTQKGPTEGLTVDLGAFTLADAGDSVLEVKHPLTGETSLGKMAKEEYAASDKTPLISIGTTGTFTKEHKHTVLAGKAFEITDIDGDMVRLTVNKVQGWLSRSDVIPEVAVKIVEKKQGFFLGDRVLITAAIGDYYGDSISSEDIVNKEATVARISASEITLSVDGLSEDVYLPAGKQSALHPLDIPLVEKTTPKLELILREMVMDRFPETAASIRFVGKFKAPELAETFVPASALVEKKAALEDKEMDSQDQNLEMKFKQTSGFSQFMSSQLQKIASQKRTMAEKIASELVMVLNRSFSPASITAATPVLDYDYEKGYQGEVVVEAKVFDNNGPKKITAKIAVVDDKYTLPKEAELSKLVSEAVAERDAFAVEMAKETQEKMAKIDAEVAFENAKVEAAMEGPKARSENQVQPKMQKTAGVGSMQPQEANIQPVFQISKQFLPQSLQIGAVIDLDGIRYKLTSKSSGQLSKGSDDASQWTFERCWNMSDDQAVYHSVNY